MAHNSSSIAGSSHTIWKSLGKTLRNLRRNASLFRAVNSPARVQYREDANAAAFRGSYFISTDRGVFALENGRLFQLTHLETYGMAIRDGRLFLAVSSDDYSSICSCVLPPRLKQGEVLEFSELYRVPITKSGRVHQIAFYRDTLALTLTASNAIFFLNPDTGEVVSECYPFRDAFGKPIKGDHNHINSVSECGDCLLFCAYKAGGTAMIGVVHEDQVRGYAASHVGAHDVYITGSTLYYSDTFGATFSEPRNESGYLMANGAAVDEEFFSVPPGFAIRGISQQGAEMVVGHSHKGSRAKRFEGQGALFRLLNGKVVHTLTTPFAQTYDIIGVDGRHFEAPSAFESWDEINRFLEEILGPSIYQAELDEAIPAAEGLEMAAA